VLILGASYYQVDTIKTAKRLGYKTITTDNNPHNPGHALADRSFNVDTTDKDGILSLAISNRIDGIISPATDVAVPTAAFVAEKLVLAGPPVIATEIVCNKRQFRQFQTDRGLPTPKSITISELDKIAEDDFSNQPWIIKPSISSGGKGVHILKSKSDLYTHLQDAKSFSLNNQYLIEEYIDGFQGTAEGFMAEGVIDQFFVMDRQTVPPPYVTTSGHQIPSELPEQIVAVLRDQIKLIWENLKVTGGAFDCDFVVRDSEVYILEITPRVGGNSISRLLKYAADFGIIERSLRYVCGAPVFDSTENKIQPHALMIFGVESSGKLIYNETQAAELSSEKWVHHIEIDYPQGQHVHRFENSRHRVGECIIYGRDRSEVKQRIDEVRYRIDLRVEA